MENIENISSYAFGNMSRIGLDDCSHSQKDIQNMGFNNYLLQNFFSSDCSMQNPINLATSQVGVNYIGGHNTATGGCNIDDSSNLQIGTIQTYSKSKIDLFHRPFATVPYLGRGVVNPVMESQIQQGEMEINKKSVNNLGEKCYSKYYTTPLLSSVQERITNPAFSVEGVASAGWIRGGIPSRELTRDKK